MKRRLLALMSALSVAACQGDASETPPAAAVDITGSWRGVIVQPGSTVTVRFTARQEPGRAGVAGTYVSDKLASGNVTGTVEGDVFRFQAVVTTPGCPGELSGTATVVAAGAPPWMSLTYSGRTDCGPEAGQFVLEREITALPQ